MASSKPLKQLEKAHDTLRDHNGGSLEIRNLLDKIQHKLTSSAAELLEAFSQWDISLAQLDRDRDITSTKPYHLIVLMLTELTLDDPDAALPDWFLPYVVRLCAIEHGLYFNARVKAIFEQLHASLDWLDFLKSDTVRGHWSSNQCLTLLDLIDDQGELARILDMVLLDTHTTLSYIDEQGRRTSHSGCDVERLVRRLFLSGPTLRAQLESHMAPDLPLQTAQVILHLARHANSPRSASTHVTALAHKSKEIQDLAISSLAYLGARARHALEQGAGAKKKSVRQLCQDLLGNLPEQPRVDPFLDLDEQARQELLESIFPLLLLTSAESKQCARNKTPKKWEPLLALAATRPELYLSAVSSAYFATSMGRELIEAMLRQEAFDGHELYGWTAFMRAQVQLHAANAYDRRFIFKEFQRVPAKHVPQILSEVLPTGFGSMMVDLLPVYLEGGAIDDPVIYVRALTYHNKGVRDLAIAKARALAFEDMSPIVAQLDERKKSARQDAAEALFKVPAALLEPHIPTLKERLATEKDEGVQGALMAAIARIEPA